MPARLHHFDRPSDRAVDVVNAEHHDRVRYKLFDWRRRQPDSFETRRLDGQHGGDILAMQSLHKHVKHFTRAAVGAIVARLSIRRQGWQGVDEHPPGADLRGFGEQEAIRLLEFLLQHRASGEDDLDLALPLELRKVPSKLRGVADDFEWRDLEQHDQSRLIEFGDTAIDEFQAKRRFSAPCGPFDQDDIAAGDPTAQNPIEARNGRLHEIWFSHTRPDELYALRRASADRRIHAGLQRRWALTLPAWRPTNPVVLPEWRRWRAASPATQSRAF